MHKKALGVNELKHEEHFRNNTLGVILMLLCAACLCAGQFIWKMYDGLLPVLTGFVIYGIGALVMLCAYRFGNLSVLQPINSVSYIIAAILGAVFFQEAVSLKKGVGILLIMIGVFFLAKGEQRK